MTLVTDMMVKCNECLWISCQKSIWNIWDNQMNLQQFFIYVHNIQLNFLVKVGREITNMYRDIKIVSNAMFKFAY